MHLLEAQREEYYEIWRTEYDAHGVVRYDGPDNRYAHGTVRFFRPLEIVRKLAADTERYENERLATSPLAHQRDNRVECYVVAVSVTKRIATTETVCPDGEGG